MRFRELMEMQRRIIVRAWLSCLPWTLMHRGGADRMVREALR